MIRCASVSLFMGPYISNYVQSELALTAKFEESGNHLIHIFPKDVEHFAWVDLFRKSGYVLYFIDVCPRTWKSISTFRQIFRKEKINLIHVHFGGWDIDVRLAAPTIPTVWHQRMSVNLDTVKRRIYHNLMYKVVGRFKTHHIAISDAVNKAITSLTSNKCYFIPDGIDFRRLQFEEAITTDMSQPCRILLFAFSALGKGVDIAIKACEIFNREQQLVELQIVTQENTDKYLAANFPELPSWLKVLPPISNVSEYYNSADVFLSASRSEGFCNALLEAIYCGRPCVYSDIPGTRWAGDFAGTYMYEVENPESLAEAIKNCINTPLIEEDIKNNRKLAERRYSLDTWTESVYEALLESSKM